MREWWLNQSGTAYGSSEIYMKAALAHERHHSDATDEYHQ